MSLIATLHYLMAAVATILAPALTAPNEPLEPFTIFVNNGGLEFSIERATSVSVGEVLATYGISLTEYDRVTPPHDTPAINRMHIQIIRARHVSLNDGGEYQELHTTALTIGEAFLEAGITLNPQDRVTPPLEETLTPLSVVRIIRVSEQDITREVRIPFPITYSENPALLYGRERLIEEGEEGIRYEEVREVYENKLKTREQVLASRVTTPPKTEVRERGTKIEIGRIQEGGASWYAFKGGMFAASTTIPKGKYAKVTKVDSGTSIIVQINDYGPHAGIHPDRVIDLDAVAFKKLAPLGKGVIQVKVEEIL